MFQDVLNFQFLLLLYSEPSRDIAAFCTKVVTAFLLASEALYWHSLPSSVSLSGIHLGTASNACSQLIILCCQNGKSLLMTLTWQC